MVEQISRVAVGCAKPVGAAVSRASSLDVLKCFAAFCVVCIHCEILWQQPLVRCGVPIFFMITGYYYPMMVEKGKFWKHIRKLLIMLFWASAFYVLYSLQYVLRHGIFGEWVGDTFNSVTIYHWLVFNLDLFSGHLWYFYAVLYDLIIFYFADKWRLTKWLRYAAPLLLLLFCIGNFMHIPIHYSRNFLFMGLPCMMIGRCIRENKDKPFRFLSNERYTWIFTFAFLLLSFGEALFLKKIMGNYHREMYIFTLPMILPCFYWVLRHPGFGEGSWAATIGRKYSAYIYIFNFLFAYTILPRFIDRSISPIMDIAYPILVFLVSLLVSWLFVRAKQLVMPRSR